jgi:hypothetical protein
MKHEILMALAEVERQHAVRVPPPERGDCFGNRAIHLRFSGRLIRREHGNF